MSGGTLIHATCVAIGGRGVLIAGPSGAGKSDLALRLIDRGARLVSDDYTVLKGFDSRVLAEPPPRTAGLIEVRGIGIVDMPFVTQVAIDLLVDLDLAVERMPEPAMRRLEGCPVPVLALAALEASAPIKVELALARQVAA